MKTNFSPRTWAALTMMVLLASVVFVGCATDLSERNPASATCSNDNSSDQVCDEGYVKYDRKARLMH